MHSKCLHRQQPHSLPSQSQIANPSPRAPLQQNTAPRADHMHQTNTPYQTLRPFIQCNNWRRKGHPLSKCYASRGGLEGQTPWKMSQGQFTQTHTSFPNHSVPSQAVNSTQSSWQHQCPSHLHKWLSSPRTSSW